MMSSERNTEAMFNSPKQAVQSRKWMIWMSQYSRRVSRNRLKSRKYGLTGLGPDR